MSAFTDEQQETLTAMGKVAISYISGVHELVSMLTSQMAAMKVLMVTKGLVTEEEQEETVKEIDAGTAVAAVFSPELAALEEGIRRQLNGG